MNRLGAFEWGEPPIRPKNMQRRRFKRLADELLDAWVRDASAHFGVPLDRDALGTLMTDEVIHDIARKRVAEIALRRRRRKSSN